MATIPPGDGLLPIGPVSPLVSRLCLVGGRRRLSDRLARHLGAEIGCDDLLRVERLSDLLEGRGAGSLILVEVELLDDETDAVARLDELSLLSRIALCYSGVPPVARLRDALAAKRLGAVSVVGLDGGFDLFAAALKIVLGGTTYYSPEFVTALLRPAAEAEARASVLLTDREMEVLELVAQGMSNRSIAQSLAITEHTVKLHVHHIHRKLGVSNRTAAANWFHSRGL